MKDDTLKVLEAFLMSPNACLKTGDVFMCNM